MNDIVERYYNGYEGEPEIQIIRKTSHGEDLALRIWTGFFDNIMGAIEPEETGWTSLAYYYNLYIGWYEDNPWLLNDIKSAIKQLKGIDDDRLNGKSKEVLKEIIKIFEMAVQSGDDILIAYE